MKKYILFLITIAIGCQTRDTQKSVSLHSTAVSVVVDVTDKKKLWPVVIEPILSVYQCDRFPDAEHWFHLSLISDKKLNPGSTVYLQNAQATEQENTEDDPQYRSKKIVDFYAKIKNDFAGLYRQNDTAKSLPFSECWSTICTALQTLSEDSSQGKFLLVFSDLFEKSKIYNAYVPLSKLNAKAIADKLNRAYPAPKNLKGVTIIIVYQPADRESDQRFEIMLLAYKLVLEKMGAQVIAQANNTSYPL